MTPKLAHQPVSDCCPPLEPKRPVVPSALAAFSLILLASSVARAEKPQKLTLKHAVALALQKNPSVHAAQDYAQAVRRTIAMAQAGRYPKLDFSEGFTRGNNPVYVFGSLLTQRQFTARNFALGFLNVPPPLDNFKTEFTGAVPLYDAGETGRQIRNARLAAAAADQGAQRTRQQVIFAVIQAFFDELLARANVRVAEAAVAMTRADLARAKARERQGLTVPSDVLSAQVQLAVAMEGLIRARNGQAIAQAALNVAIGLPESAPTEAEGKFSLAKFATGTLAEQQQYALEHRPDYREAAIGQARAANGVSMARRRFLPTVGLFGSWEEDNQTFATRGGNNWVAGAALTFNIFNGGADRARLQETQARESQAQALKQQMAAQVRFEVEEAYLDMTAARQRVVVSRTSAAEAEESLQILRNRYATGLATMTDLLRAENAETTARRDHLNAIYDYWLAAASLELATGRLAPRSKVVAQQTIP
jgi:outer membrane protein TolC